MLSGLRRKAPRAEYERQKGAWVFDVEIIKGATAFAVAKTDPFKRRMSIGHCELDLSSHNAPGASDGLAIRSGMSRNRAQQ
jgi:hypothetical protein